MDELSFVCEIMAQDVDMVDKPFAYAFNYEKHVKECEFNPEYELYLSFDFNHDPVTCICAQLIDGQLRIFKEYKLANSNIYELCERIVTDFSDALLIVTGDATGNNTSAMVRDSINYYKIIIQLLNISRNQVKVPTVNPRIEQNRTLLNSVLQRGNVIISPDCKGLIFDLKYVQVDDVGKIIKDRSTEAAKADLLDCGRYLINLTHKDFIKQINDNTSDNM
jgi:phage terminase large subunit